MLDKGSCEVHWRLRGNIAVFPIDVDMVSTFGLDLITGRVNSHRHGQSYYIAYKIVGPTSFPSQVVSRGKGVSCTGKTHRENIALDLGSRRFSRHVQYRSASCARHRPTEVEVSGAVNHLDPAT